MFSSIGKLSIGKSKLFIKYLCSEVLARETIYQVLMFSSIGKSKLFIKYLYSQVLANYLSSTFVPKYWREQTIYQELARLNYSSSTNVPKYWQEQTIYQVLMFSSIGKLFIKYLCSQVKYWLPLLSKLTAFSQSASPCQQAWEALAQIYFFCW